MSAAISNEANFEEVARALFAGNRSQFNELIGASSMVTPYVALQRDAIFRVYAMLKPNDPAMAKINQWLNGNPEANPFKRSAHESVSVEVTSAIPQTAESWQVDWVETETDRQGVQKGPGIPMRALVTRYIDPPDRSTTPEQIRKNSLGIFVSDFSWSKQL